MSENRAQWKSKMGFILAASGSAIGLGNIVFFPANAYKYGGGAFYVPYFIALFLIGIPLMITEFGLGGMFKKSFPMAMRKAGGGFGEFVGWFAILNAGFIAMYYITLLGWVAGMEFLALTQPVGETFDGVTKIPWLGGKEGGGDYPNPAGAFFNMISTWTPLIGVMVVWALNILLVSRGTKTIEAAVKIFVPAMWIAMLVLIVQGLSLPGGYEGVKFLFTPEPDALLKPQVWQGAMSQIFFTLTLGFGVMTAYASYLPKNSDHTHNALTTSLLNCGFEWIAGIAIFSMLFAFSIAPKASTLSMMFFIVPKGIATLPAGAQVFAIGFFFLLLIAGLTSSISLLEAVVSAAHDKFKAKRMKTLLICSVFGFAGSVCFAIPKVIDNGLVQGGTLGLTLLDLVDHWAFTYGLLIVGLLECIVIGWVMGSEKIKDFVNLNSRIKLGAWFDILLRFVVPGLILFVLVWVISQEDGIYGHKAVSGISDTSKWLSYLPLSALLIWAIATTVGAYLLSKAKGHDDASVAEEEQA